METDSRISLTQDERALLVALWQRRQTSARWGLKLTAAAFILDTDFKYRITQEAALAAGSQLAEKKLVCIDAYTDAHLTEEGVARAPLLLGPEAANSWS